MVLDVILHFVARAELEVEPGDGGKGVPWPLACGIPAGSKTVPVRSQSQSGSESLLATGGWW
jgi:hypothetical protein